MTTEKVESFFKTYANDLASGIGDRIAERYDLPSFMLMTPGAPGRPITDRSELGSSFASASELYRKHGFGDPIARVTRTDDLTPTITLAWVTWDYRDTDGAPIYEADYLYVLRDTDDKTVIASVYSINEQERLQAWLTTRSAGP